MHVTTTINQSLLAPAVMTSPLVTIDNAQCGDDGHAGECRDCHDNPTILEATVDDAGQEQRRRLMFARLAQLIVGVDSA